MDFRSAFDSVNRKSLFGYLRGVGVPGKLVNAMEAIYRSTEGVVSSGGKCSGTFRMEKGLRQGCVLSPTLFNCFMRKLVVALEEVAGGHGVMMGGSGQVLENVSAYCYLGVWLSATGGCGKQAEVVGGKMRQAMAAVLGVCRKGGIHNFGTKLCLRESLVCSILKYGMQIYGMADVSKYRGLKTVFLKRMLGLPMSASNKLVLLESGQVDIDMECMMAALSFRRRLMGLDGKRNSRFLAEFLVKNDVGWGRELRGCCEKFGYPGLLETVDIGVWESGVAGLLRNS